MFKTLICNVITFITTSVQFLTTEITEVEVLFVVVTIKKSPAAYFH